MEFKDYKELMKKRLMGYFDLSEERAYGGYQLDLFAESNMRTERYFAMKKFKVYAMENDEFCLLKHFDMVTEDIVDGYISMLIKAIDELVTVREDHMSSTLTGVIVTDHLDDKALEKKIRKFRHQKSFAFGFKGWVDVRLILVDLEGCRVVASKKAVKVEDFYQP